VIVPKYGHSSVERNLVKRRLRSLVRCELLPAVGPIEFVVRALPSAYGASFAALQSDIARIGSRLASPPSDSGSTPTSADSGS
jgi:ribonuclease P protein component